jgi:hypothetical protein
LLRWGPIQIVERFSRVLLGRRLARKAARASLHGACDVVCDARRLKLHLNSHKASILQGSVSGSECKPDRAQPVSE